MINKNNLLILVMMLCFAISAHSSNMKTITGVVFQNPTKATYYGESTAIYPSNGEISPLRFTLNPNSSQQVDYVYYDDGHGGNFEYKILLRNKKTMRKTEVDVYVYGSDTGVDITGCAYISYASGGIKMKDNCE